MKSLIARFQDFWRPVDDYWFGEGSPTAFGLFRIIISSLALLNLLMLAPDWEAWFSERGFVPRSLNTLWNGPDPILWKGGPSIPRFDLLMWTTNDAIGHIFFWLVAVACLLSIIGLWSRYSTVAMALGVLTLQHRDMIVLHGGDTVLRLACLYIAMGPSGATCSVDRLIGLWRGEIAHGPVRASLWVQRIVTYNTALLYLTTVWIKRSGSHWLDGTATWYTARLAEFYRFPVPSFVSQLPLVRVTTYATLFIEFALGTLVFFRPLRNYVVLAGIGMHMFIDYSMNIPLFSFLMCSLYVCFFDGEEFGVWAERVGNRLRRLRVTVRLPKGYRLSPNAVAVLNAVDPFQLVNYLPGETAEWCAQGPAERPLSPPRASLLRSVGAWVIAPIPGLWRRLLQNSLEPEGT